MGMVAQEDNAYPVIHELRHPLPLKHSALHFEKVFGRHHIPVRSRSCAPGAAYYEVIASGDIALSISLTDAAPEKGTHLSLCVRTPEGLILLALLGLLGTGEAIRGMITSCDTIDSALSSRSRPIPPDAKQQLDAWISKGDALLDRATETAMHTADLLGISPFASADASPAECVRLWHHIAQPRPALPEPAAHEVPALCQEARIVADFDLTYDAMKRRGDVQNIDDWLRNRGVFISDRQFRTWRKRWGRPFR